METGDQWNRRAGGILSVLYLVAFALSEAYSALAAALDTSARFPSWERPLGWALVVLPATLLASLYLLHGKRRRLGFSIVIGNLCLYASFLIFELSQVNAPSVSARSLWEVGGIWVVLFLVAALAARFLEAKTGTRNS